MAIATDEPSFEGLDEELETGNETPTDFTFLKGDNTDPFKWDTDKLSTWEEVLQQINDTASSIGGFASELPADAITQYQPMFGPTLTNGCALIYNGTKETSTVLYYSGTDDPKNAYDNALKMMGATPNYEIDKAYYIGKMAVFNTVQVGGSETATQKGIKVNSTSIINGKEVPTTTLIPIVAGNNMSFRQDGTNVYLDATSSSSSNVVVDYTVTEDTNEIVLDGLDLVNDGGVWDYFIETPTTGTLQLHWQVNNITTNYCWSFIQAVSNTTSEAAFNVSGWNRRTDTKAQMFLTSGGVSIGKGTFTLISNKIIQDGTNGSTNSSWSQILLFSSSLKTNVDNVTIIKFITNDNQIIPQGTRILITRRK